MDGSRHDPESARFSEFNLLSSICIKQYKRGMNVSEKNRKGGNLSRLISGVSAIFLKFINQHLKNVTVHYCQ